MKHLLLLRTAAISRVRLFVEVHWRHLQLVITIVKAYVLLKSHLYLVFQLLEFAHDLRVASIELVLFRLHRSHLALVLATTTTAAAASSGLAGVVLDHLLQSFVLIVHLSESVLDLLPQLVGVALRPHIPHQVAHLSMTLLELGQLTLDLVLRLL